MSTRFRDALRKQQQMADSGGRPAVDVPDNPGRRVDVGVHLFEAVAPWRRKSSVKTLKGRVGALMDVVGRSKRAAVGGGSVVRALLGLDPRACDLDLLVPKADADEAIALLMARPGSEFSDEQSSDPDSKRAVIDTRFVGRVDVVIVESVADAIARFDIRAAGVATDGVLLLAVDGALDDIRTRTLTITRRTHYHRISKYMELGLDPKGLADIDDLFRYGFPGVCWAPSEQHLSRAQVLGLDLNLDVRVRKP